MLSSNRRVLRLVLPLIIFILGCPSPTPPPDISQVPESGLTLLGETYFLAPESSGAFLVQVRDPDTNQPAVDAQVTVLLGEDKESERQLFRGATDDRGLIEVRFDVPAEIGNPEQLLTVIAETDQRTSEYRDEVYIGSVFNVLLSTDKPVYQPGQTIHVRGLALESNALAAAQGKTLEITVEDPEGNKLMRKPLTTSQFGIAAVDFQLDSQAASGDYIISAEMGPTRSTRSVEVKPYTLPCFEVTFQSDKAFYMPGEMAGGTVDAQYFFGKPVAGGQVNIKVFATDYERFLVFELSGETDDAGVYRYDFQVPDYFVGQLENNTAEIDLEITVVDTANHAESIDESITVAEEPILVEAVPESGFLQPGLENIIYLSTTYPDGRAAPTTLAVTSSTFTGTITAETDDFGLATVALTPRSRLDVELEVEATDADGQSATQRVTLGTSVVADAVLLRPDKAVYQIGDTLNLDVHVAGRAATVYLDVIKGRQTFGLVALPVRDGLAQAAIGVDGSLLGTLELNAYVLTDSGAIVRDRRLVLVNPAPATVDVETDAQVYAPGDTAVLNIGASRQGEPMVGAVGISIVDESVFAVGAEDPGFARTYFLLERELLEPRYEIHDFSNLADDDYSPYDDNPDSIRTANAGDTGPVAIGRDTARQLALFGFFGQELALDADARRTVELAQAAADKSARADQVAVAYGWANRLFLVMPLLGLALYDGTRRRRRLLIGLTLFSLAAFFWVACGAPAAAPAAEMAAPAESATTATRGEAQPPRLRQFFPETLFWAAQVETDADGRVQLEVPIADSITTWRISVIASDQAGNLGSAELGMRVFQDFFVEPDLPRFLTVGDELAVPVSIFNYLDEPQEIELTVKAAGWFEFVEEAQIRLTLAPNEVAAAYIPIRITGFGLHDLQITAIGSQMSDAVLRQVEVLPNGQTQTTVESGRLGDSQSFAVNIPEQAIPGTTRVTVKLYPGIVSQVIDGLEGLLQRPYGCFEQTSSTTYPNVLVLDYLKRTGQVNPRLQLRAEQYINLGYQRLLSFEVRGVPGGFSLFGDPPPQTMLTAYGLLEFGDMSQVSYVDPALLERTAGYLFDRQSLNGSWDPEGMTIESGIEQLRQGNLPATAYITWALADAGYANSEPVQRALSYIHEETYNLLEKRSDGTAVDSYVLALIANAMVAGNGESGPILDALIAQAERGDDGAIFWPSSSSTWLDARGQVASLETTALVASALLRTGYQVETAKGAIDYLISQRDRYGSFHTTQATILTLKALLLAAEQGEEDALATVRVSLSDGRTETVEIDAGNADVMQQISFDDLGLSTGELSIALQGERNVQYQVITEYVVPWSAVTPPPIGEATMRVDVRYDRSELQVNDTVDVQAEVELLARGIAGTVLVDLGVPPGFSPISEDLDALVKAGTISRYELTGRQIIVYMTNVRSGVVFTLDYRLRARLPIKAQTPASQAYDYYTPERQDTDAPQRIVVTLGTPGN